jgi:hypothetical protein
MIFREQAVSALPDSGKISRWQPFPARGEIYFEYQVFGYLRIEPVTGRGSDCTSSGAYHGPSTPLERPEQAIALHDGAVRAVQPRFAVPAVDPAIDLVKRIARS